MKINIKHIAQLARLTLTNKEEQKFNREIIKVVKYVDQLAQVNVTKEEATSRLNQINNDLREDMINSWPAEEKLAAINLAPRKKGKLIAVPRIFES